MTDKRAFLKLDVSPEQKAQWIRAANAQGLKLSEWVRDTLDDERARLVAQGVIRERG